MWSQIISSSLQMPKMAILPSDNYCLMTIFWLCPEVVIISNTHCIFMGKGVRFQIFCPKIYTTQLMVDRQMGLASLPWQHCNGKCKNPARLLVQLCKV